MLRDSTAADSHRGDSLGVRELQTDEVQHLWPMGLVIILDELAKFQLAVCLPGHIDDIDDFVTTCRKGKRDNGGGIILWCHTV